jgi:hypothetical protein
MIAVVLSIGLALAAEPHDPLAHRRYRFCQNPGLDAAEALAWCGALEALPPERCPGLREVCAGSPPVRAGGCGEPDEAETRRLWQKSREDGSELEVPACALPKDLPDLGWLRWVTAAVVVGVVAFVARRLLRLWGGAKTVFTPLSPASREPELSLTDAPIPADDWRAAAERALREERWGEALALGHGAARAHLLRDLRTSSTDREILGQLPADSAQARAWREIVRAAEAPLWGALGTEADRARRVVAAALQIVAVVAFAMFGGSEAALAGGDRASGDSAWIQVFRRAGYSVTVRSDPFAEQAPDADVLVVRAEDLPSDDRALETLRNWVSAGGVMLAVGDVHALFPELGERIAVVERPTPTSQFPPELPLPTWPDDAIWAWAEPHPSDAQIWVEAPAPEGRGALLLAMPLDGGGVLAVADERLFENAALIVPQNANFGAAVLSAAEDSGVFAIGHQARLEVASRTVSKGRPPFRAIAGSGLFPLVAQALLVAGLVLWWRGWSFGPRQPAPRESRAVFADHIRAVGARYARLGATRFALVQALRYAFARRGRTGLESALLRAGYSPNSAADRVEHWERLAADPAAPNGPADLSDVEELWTLDRTPPGSRS